MDDRKNAVTLTNSHIGTGMSIAMKYSIYILVFSVLPLTLTAQVRDTAVVKDSTYRNRLLLLPAIGSSPETGFMFGAVAVPQFKVGSAGPGTRSSNIFISAIYTTKNQILSSVIPDIILPEEQWVLNGNYFVNYFPESYWGIGPSTRNDDELTVLYTQVNLEQRVLRQVEPGLFTGPYLRWSRLFGMEFESEDGEQIPSPRVSGAEGSTSAGIGWVARWDHRNSNMTPTQNHYMELSFLRYLHWLGGTHAYTKYQLDARKYIELRGNRNSFLAFQGLVELLSGDPPFNDMAMLGGDRINRGYYRGRYRDQNSIQVQTELRQGIKGRLGFTLFAATGEVWNRFDDINLDNYKWTAGAGLRFNLNPEDPTNIRIDFGIGKETSGFYLQFGEAF